MMQCLFKSIHLCQSSFLQSGFAYEMMLPTEDVIFSQDRMIHDHIVALIRIYYFSFCILHQNDGSASQNVMLDKKIPSCCADNTNCFIKSPYQQQKRKQVEKRFFAKDKQLKSLLGLSA